MAEYANIIVDIFNEKLDKTIDNLKTKYGNNILKKAKLLSHDK